MDSDEDEEFSFEENIGQRPDRHGWKLNEILSEVETKIPSLEFDDDDNEDDLSIWSPPDNVPSFYRQFTSIVSYKKSHERENHNKQITSRFSGTECNLTISKKDHSALKFANKSVSTTNAFHKKPITTLQPQDSESLTGEDHPISCNKSTSVNIPQCLSLSFSKDNTIKERPAVQFSQPRGSESPVYEQINNVIETAVSAEICESFALMFSQLDSSHAIHTCHSLKGSHDPHLEESLSYPTDTGDELFIHKPDVAATLSEKGFNLHTPDEQQFSTASCSTISCQTNSDLLSEKGFANDEQTCSSVSCRTDQSIPERYVIARSKTSMVDPNFATDEQKANVSCQTEKNYLRNARMDDEKNNIKTDQDVRLLTSMNENDAEFGDQLDFNLLNEINFSELQSVLETLPPNHVLSVSDLYPSSPQQNAESVHVRHDELMLKLSDLSKDQLSSCSNVLDEKKDVVAESIYQNKRKVKGNKGPTKAIHTWSQLSSDDTSTQEPQTIFLDLRPEANFEKEKEEGAYSESIQRILGLKKERSDSCSESESDDELSEWHEMRTKMKKKAKEEREKSFNAITLSRRSISLEGEKVASLPCDILNAGIGKLLEEELRGGLPLDACDKYDSVAENRIEIYTGNSQNIKKSNVDIQDAAEKITHDARTLKTEANVPLRSKIGENIKRDELKSEDEVYDRSVRRTLVEDESFIAENFNLNLEKVNAQNDHINEHVPCKVEKDNTYSERHPTASAAHAGNTTDGRQNMFFNENKGYNSSSGYAKEEKEHGKIAAVERQEKELDVQLGTRSASCNDRNEVEQLLYLATNSIDIDQKETGSITTADIKISLRLSENSERNESSKYSSGRAMEKKFKKREETANLRQCKNSTESMKQHCFRTKMSPSQTIPEQKADKSSFSSTHNEAREEKVSEMNKQDSSLKHELLNSTDHKTINVMKEEKTKQPQRTITRNTGEDQHTDKSKMDTCSANSSEATKHQKQRSEKELKKLKEKLRINLENMRNVVLASGKYPAAYNTPIIYDQDASYERQHRGLMSIAEDQLELLLVVTLSGCGEINNQYSKGRTSHSGCDVNFYFALLSWFLYLCCPNNNHRSVPFVVVGMHQAFQNGLLQLFVGVQPNEKVFCTNTSKGPKKNKLRAFHKAISKYLSTHSLRLVYQNIENVYLNGSDQVDENSYSSKMLSTCITVGQDSNAVRRVFGSKPNFFWETMEPEGSNDVFQESYSCDKNVENTVVFVRAPLYYHPFCVLDLLTRIENESCDLAGLRLTNEPDPSGGVVCSSGKHEVHESVCEPQPTFVLAVRGPFAISKVKKIIGSKIPLLDDPGEIPSLRSLYCSINIEDRLFYCPSYSSQASTQLARVFGGRLTEGDILAVERSSSKSKPRSPDGVPAQKPPAFLVSSARVAFYLIVSPLVPPGFFGELLHICFLRGFVLHGMRRVQLSKRQGASLGLSQLQSHVFCPSSGNTPVQSPRGSPPGSPARRKSSFSLEVTLAITKTNISYPSTILILQKENGLYHAVSLVKHLFVLLKDWITTNPTSLPDLEETSSSMYLTISQFSEASSKSLWGDVCYKPSITYIKYARNNRFSSSSEVEQVCVLSSVNKQAIQHLGLLLKKLTNSNHIAGDWELLGMKSFPSLSLVQAREVTPYEVGDRSWLSSVKLLMSAAVFACVLRGFSILYRVRDFITVLAKMSNKEDSCLHEGWWFSQTTEVAYRQLTVLFEESELFPDETNRANTIFVPPLRQKSLQSSKDSKESTQKLHRKLYDHKAYSTDDSSSVAITRFIEVPITQSLLAGPRLLPTVVLIKPSCVLNRKKISKILKSVLQENFDIIALSMRVLTQSEAQVLVRDDVPDCDDHIQYLTSGSSLVMCLQRENAVKKLLDILGPEDPVIARSLDPFLLRGCYGVDPVHNAIHGSESYSSAISEMKMLFPCGVCCEQTVDLEAEQIPCRTFDAAIGKKTDRKLTKCLTHSSGAAHSLISSLVQVNCVILTHHIVYGRSNRKRIALADVLDCLLSTNFIFVGMKMAMLSHEQVNELLTLIDLRSHKKQGKELTERPCIILALQRDNAVSCFDLIIESVGRKQHSVTEYRKHMIEAKTEEEASNLLMYFFDGLTPNSVQQISSV